MLIDVTKLNSGIENAIYLDQDVEIEDSLIKNSEILEIYKIHINATITKDIDGFYIEGVLNGTIFLPDSLTLEPTKYDFETEINGNIDKLLEEIGENDKKIENTIEILPIIWENILMEIPIRVENKESRKTKLCGDNWKVIDSEESLSLNPELQKLKDLLK